MKNKVREATRVIYEGSSYYLLAFNVARTTALLFPTEYTRDDIEAVVIWAPLEDIYAPMKPKKRGEL